MLKFLNVVVLAACICFVLSIGVCADCDDSCCGVLWDSKQVLIYNGRAIIDCPGGGTCEYWVTKYAIPTVGEDDCTNDPDCFNMMHMTIEGPPVDDPVFIDWPSYPIYYPDETDPMEDVTIASYDCYAEVVSETNRYELIICTEACDPELPYEFHTQTCTQSCCY